MNIARTMGVKIPGKKASITLVDFSVTVPPDGNFFDTKYAPIIKYGTQVVGNGQTFEVTEDIDFNSPYSSGGIPNRIIIPNRDGANKTVSYTLVKREIVKNGVTKVFKKVLYNEDAVPFLEVILPDNNVISIESAITKEGTTFNSDPTSSEFNDSNLRWYEVDSLAEDKIFITDTERSSDNSGIKPGKWITVSKKFIKEYTDTGFSKITFGSGFSDEYYLNNYTNDSYILQIADFFNTIALGEIPKPNSTLFIRYRVGGGAASNVGTDTLKSLGFVDMLVNGPNQNLNSSVKRSLKVSNPVPAFGGGNEPSVDEIRYMTKYNFASQNRAVTIKDYIATIFKMPGKFGVPFRMQVAEDQNKIVFSILGLDSNGKLDNQSTNTLKENMATFLADYRMVNDYVLVNDGKIINLGFEIDILTEKSINQGEIVNEVIKVVKDYFDVNKWQMGQNIFMASLDEKINNINGVLNVLEVKVFNKVGQDYSTNMTQQAFLDNQTKQIDLTSDYTLFAEYNTLFEIKFPNSDINVRTKSL
jgi:hypothetical protein